MQSQDEAAQPNAATEEISRAENLIEESDSDESANRLTSFSETIPEDVAAKIIPFHNQFCLNLINAEMGLRTYIKAIYDSRYVTGVELTDQQHQAMMSVCFDLIEKLSASAQTYSEAISWATQAMNTMPEEDANRLAQLLSFFIGTPANAAMGSTFYNTWGTLVGTLGFKKAAEGYFDKASAIQIADQIANTKQDIQSLTQRIKNAPTPEAKAKALEHYNKTQEIYAQTSEAYQSIANVANAGVILSSATAATATLATTVGAVATMAIPTTLGGAAFFAVKATATMAVGSLNTTSHLFNCEGATQGDYRKENFADILADLGNKGSYVTAILDPFSVIHVRKEAIESGLSVTYAASSVALDFIDGNAITKTLTEWGIETLGRLDSANNEARVALTQNVVTLYKKRTPDWEKKHPTQLSVLIAAIDAFNKNQYTKDILSTDRNNPGTIAVREAGGITDETSEKKPEKDAQETQDETPEDNAQETRPEKTEPQAGQEAASNTVEQTGENENTEEIVDTNENPSTSSVDGTDHEKPVDLDWRDIVPDELQKFIDIATEEHQAVQRAENLKKQRQAQEAKRRAQEKKRRLQEQKRRAQGQGPKKTPPTEKGKPQKPKKPTLREQSRREREIWGKDDKGGGCGH